MLTSCNLEEIETLSFSQVALTTIPSKNERNALTDRTSITNSTTNQYYAYHQLKKVQRQMEFYKEYYQNDMKLKKFAQEIGEGDIVQAIFEFRETFANLNSQKEESTEEMVKLFQQFRKQMAEVSACQHSSSGENSSYMSNCFEEKYIQLTQTLYQKIARIDQLQQIIRNQHNSNSNSSKSSQNNSQNQKENMNPNVSKQFTDLKKSRIPVESSVQKSINIGEFQCAEYCQKVILKDNKKECQQIINGYKHVFKQYITACNTIWKILYKYFLKEDDMLTEYQNKNNKLLVWYSNVNHKSYENGVQQILEYVDSCNQRSKYLDRFVLDVKTLISKPLQQATPTYSN